MLRQAPENKDKNNFIQVTNQILCDELQSQGFMPLYFYDGVFFFIKNKDIEEVVRKFER